LNEIREKQVANPNKNYPWHKCPNHLKDDGNLLEGFL
jgi:hypothetical protein